MGISSRGGSESAPAGEHGTAAIGRWNSRGQNLFCTSSIPGRGGYDQVGWCWRWCAPGGIGEGAIGLVLVDGPVDIPAPMTSAPRRPPRAMSPLLLRCSREKTTRSRRVCMADGGAEQPVVNIVGELVALGPGRRDLVPLLYRWDNDFAMGRTQGGTPIPWTLEAEYAAYEADQGRGQYATFIIYRRADWRPIGFTAWHDIDYRHGNARFIIGIGEPEARGKGYGTEATRLMLDYAFTALGLRSAMLTVYAYNLAGLAAYRKAGFREVGRQRQCHRMGRRYWDMVYMDCLASEFESPVLGKVFVPDEPRG